MIRNHTSIFGVSKVCDIYCPSQDHIVRINNCSSERDAIKKWNNQCTTIPKWLQVKIEMMMEEMTEQTVDPTGNRGWQICNVILSMVPDTNDP